MDSKPKKPSLFKQKIKQARLDEKAQGNPDTSFPKPLKINLEQVDNANTH